jgi:hypothetical protein
MKSQCARCGLVVNAIDVGFDPASLKVVHGGCGGKWRRFAIPSRISLFVGPLAAPLEQWCERHQKTPSEATRTALSKLLRVEQPAMEGHVETIKRVNAAKRTKRKASRVRGTGSG